MTEAMRVGVRPGDPGTLTVRFWAGARAAAGTDRVSMPVGTVKRVRAELLAWQPDLAPVLEVSSLLADGLVVGDDAELAEQVAFLQNSVGAVQGPFDSFLALRGLKTLHLRMRAHCENAQALAEWLQSHPAIEAVIYPGLASHPHHALAKRQMDGFGGMLSVRVKGGLDGARRFRERLELFTLAESLGGVESLVNHPAVMTHASIPPDRRAQLGNGDELVRLSVGVEALEDLRRDLAHALA